MNWRLLVLVLVLSWGGWMFAQDEHGHEGHQHGGPPPSGLTVTSLILTTSGAIMVSLTLLAILWKPIDAAFRLSRFRTCWEKRATRVAFGAGIVMMVALAVGVATVLSIESHEHEHEHESGETEGPQPQHGGQMQTVDRYAVELVLRRTGEIRLYFNVLQGDVPTGWDVKGEVRPVQGFHAGTPTNAVPLKLNSDSSYFVTVLHPPQERQAGVHLTLRVRKESYELDFRLPVRD